ncbi:MAG: MtnX-like HAD-IB family phosphatase [Tepidanaerobacteraceae bacterium]|nr:MtnX-like HAD-IB family phosphatase [Tepidanaerobacteraceae bacterium]
MKLAFFVDFDGTITKEDTCEAMVKAFAKGDWKSLDKKWQEGKLSTEECARQTFEMFDADEESVKNFLRENMEIDDYFVQFANLCRQSGHSLYILSDGYDFNIRVVFEKFGITNIPYFANELVISGRSFDIRCPYHSKSCSQCGVCKTDLMLKLKPEGALAVYIGDGYSDICPAKSADVVFAKGTLLMLCRKNKIPAREFRDFSDIIREYF